MSMSTTEIFKYITTINIDDYISGKVSVVTALPTGKVATDTVTFQDLIDMGIIVLPSS